MQRGMLAPNFMAAAVFLVACVYTAHAVDSNPSSAFAALLDSTQKGENASLLTVVIPCAGLGTRLGLPYPKEMHMVGANTALIDLSLRHLEPYAAQIRSVVIVIEPRKSQLVQYLEKWRSILPIHFCFFDERYYEWAGSILSAEALFGENNLVLLPDSLLQASEGRPIVPTILELLSKYGVVFGYVEETRADRLKALGALSVAVDGVVTSFCDKPSENLQTFNGFWGCFGFRRGAARSLLKTMMSSIARNPVEISDFQAPVGAFPLAKYLDLGTWPNLHQAVEEKLFSSGDPRKSDDPSVPRP